MRLISMRIKNFRPFYGDMPLLNFAHGERNVTVFHAANGGGKTALLNAFTWVLYKRFSRGFLLPEQLVNKRAIREAKLNEEVEGFVELIFDDEGKRYRIKRTASVKRTNNEQGWIPSSDGHAILQWAGQDGRWTTDERVSEVIGRILPTDLHTYFFFDGERIERIVQPTRAEQDEIANATKKFLGVEVLNRAERHLRGAKKDLERELKEIGDTEVVLILERKAVAEQEISALQDKDKLLLENISGFTKQREMLEKRLRELAAVKDIQLRRDRLNAECDTRRDAISNAKDIVASELSSRGYMVYLRGFATTYRELIDSLRKKGELPAGIKQNFVQELLSTNECICGAVLSEGSKARELVEAWLARAGLVDVEEKAIRMGGEITNLERGIPTFWQHIDQAQKRREFDRKELSRAEAELEAIGEQLKNSPVEEVSAIQQKFERTKVAIDEAQMERGSIQSDIGRLEKDVAKLEQELSKHQAQEARQRIAQQRVKSAAEATVRIVRIRELLEEDFRTKLADKIRTHFSQMSYKPYTPDLTAQYALRLLESAGGDPLPVAASQGENQILSLAFIGSIIEQSREYRARQDRLPGPDSSQYPVVMDSPFGSLGANYRSQVASRLPKFADQVVMLVTKTQWREEVERALEGKVGRTYVMQYYTSKEDFEPESIELEEKTMDLIQRSSNSYEYTQIVEVTNG